VNVFQSQWNPDTGWNRADCGSSGAQLVLMFGSTDALSRQELIAEVQQSHPEAYLLGCSTAGEILGNKVADDSLTATACTFAHSHIRTAEVALDQYPDSAAAGDALARQLRVEGLAHVFVLSDGLNVNGTTLVQGLARGLPAGVAVTGGLAGDGARFARTLLCAGGQVRSGAVAAVGFIGDRLRVGYGSMGGWDTFGPERIVTRSRGNVLFELDGQSALELYKRYLGEHAAGLPASGLLFPLSIRADANSPSLVRTILGTNETDGSMTFAGDIPEGHRAQLMRANMERLIDGALGAAQHSDSITGGKSELGILISCVGRKLVLRQRVEEEVEAVAEVLGHTRLSGFYSYGEISPRMPTARCELHNQTMTITTLREV